MYRKSLLFIFLVTACVPVTLNADDRPAKDQIRTYITQAAAMQRADFNQMATMSTSPKAEDVEDKSLTLLLFAHRFSPDNETEQFQLLSGYHPKPAELAQIVNRGFGGGALFIPTAPVSIIQQDYITDVTCEVDGEQASGVVSFEVPKVYRGKVTYIAEKKPSHWHITELMMSDLDLHLVRGEGGIWIEKEAKSQ